jgi:hypothetical protein
MNLAWENIIKMPTASLQESKGDSSTNGKKFI